MIAVVEIHGLGLMVVYTPRGEWPEGLDFVPYSMSFWLVPGTWEQP